MPADREQQKVALKRATSMEAVRKAKEVSGWERRMYQQVDRAGTKPFTGYPTLPGFAPGFPLNPTRKAELDQTNANLAVTNSNLATTTNTANAAYSQAFNHGHPLQNHSHTYEYMDTDGKMQSARTGGI